MTGKPVSSTNSLSKSRNKAPPPVSTMPFSAISAPSSGGVCSNADFTAPTIEFNGSVSASKISFDENHVRDSIMTPQAHIAAGFPRPSPMPSFQGQLSESELSALIEYIKGLK